MMRVVHGLAVSLLAALGVLAVAAGVSFVVWQAPAVQAGIFAGD